MLLNVVNKRAGEPQKLIVLLTIIIGDKKAKGNKGNKEKLKKIKK